MKHKMLSPTRPFPSTGFARLPQVLEVYPVSKSKLYAEIRAGRFPASEKLSERISAWRVDLIRAKLGI